MTAPKKPAPAKPGIYHDWDIEKYHQDPALSKTNFLRFQEAATPAHYEAHEEKETDGLNLGTIFHMAVLEPDRYAKEVVVAGADVLSKSGSRAGNAWKAFKDQADKNGQLILTKAQMDTIMRMEEALWDGHNEEAKELMSLKKKTSEISFVWEDPETGLRSKCRPDKLPGGKIVADLKTTGVNHPREFFRVAAHKQYLWSAVHTLDGVSVCTGVRHDVYKFVVVELDATKKKGVSVYEPYREHCVYARTQLASVKRRLAKCIKENDWPGYPAGSQPLELPPWAITQMKFSDQAGEAIHD